jgi:Na+/proline symporter
LPITPREIDRQEEERRREAAEAAYEQRQEYLARRAASDHSNRQVLMVLGTIAGVVLAVFAACCFVTGIIAVFKGPTNGTPSTILPTKPVEKVRPK